MTLYRICASDSYTIVQAQYALSSHQEEVRKEPWFLEFVFRRLVNEILNKLDGMEEFDEPLMWEGWTEVWKYSGEMEWD